MLNWQYDVFRRSGWVGGGLDKQSKQISTSREICWWNGFLWKHRNDLICLVTLLDSLIHLVNRIMNRCICNLTRRFTSEKKWMEWLMSTSTFWSVWQTCQTKQANFYHSNDLLSASTSQYYVNLIQWCSWMTSKPNHELVSSWTDSLDLLVEETSKSDHESLIPQFN